MEVNWIVPGRLETKTGGYIYDRLVIEALRVLGHQVHVHVVEEALPDTGELGDRALEACFTQIRTGTTTVVDGLAVGGHPTPLERHTNRLKFVDLVHHPLAMETGLTETRAHELRALERRSLRASLEVICTSEPTAELLVREFGVQRSRIEIAAPGCKVTSSEPALLSFPLRLVAVGTVTPRKGYDVLLHALARVPKSRWTCRCVGSLSSDPVEAAKIQQLVARLGLEECVHFVGELSDRELEQEWERAHLMVSASRYEGFGMAVSEALARGLPVVATDVGGVPTLARCGAAFLVERGDVEGLGFAIERFISDSAWRDELRRNARQSRLKVGRSWRSVASQFVGVLDKARSHQWRS